MKFKKILAASLTATSVLALVACGGTESTKKHEVKFETGEKGSYVATQSVVDGEKAVKPANPTHSDGLGFVTWKSDGVTYNFNDPVTKNLKLEAEWAASAFTVTFTTGYESEGLTVPSQSVAKDGTATEPSTDSLPWRAGYEITGWQVNSSDFNFSTTITENITLNAVWTAVATYTVTLDNATIKETIDSSLLTQTVNEGRSVVIPQGQFTNKTNENDQYGGWQVYDNSNKTTTLYDTSTAVTSDLSLSPKWTKSLTGNTSRTYLEDTLGSDWKIDDKNYGNSHHIQNPYNTSNTSDNVLKIGRPTNAQGGSNTNSVNKLATSTRSEGNQVLVSFDVRAEEAAKSALTIKFYANRSTSSNAEVARMKIYGTSASGGGANIQWGVYKSGGWDYSLETPTSSSLSFNNTSLNSDYRVQNTGWITIQVLFEYVMVDGKLELCAHMYANGIHLYTEGLVDESGTAVFNSKGYLTGVPLEKSIFNNGDDLTITGINFSPDKQSTGDIQSDNFVYINNLYIENKQL